MYALTEHCRNCLSDSPSEVRALEFGIVHYCYFPLGTYNGYLYTPTLSLFLILIAILYLTTS